MQRDPPHSLLTVQTEEEELVRIHTDTQLILQKAQTLSYSLSLSLCVCVCMCVLSVWFVCRGVRWPLITDTRTLVTQLPCLLPRPRSSSAHNRPAASDAGFSESLITLQRSRIPLAHDFWHSLLNIVVVVVQNLQN